MAQFTTLPSLSIADLPDEILLLIFSYLDIPELLCVSRTSHHTRYLALDPLLHTHRLRHTTNHLSTLLPHRPALSSLTPPNSTIYLSPTLFLARTLSRRLIAVGLNRKLAKRPGGSGVRMVSRRGPM